LAIIAQLMGHSQIQTTTRYIANVAAVHQQAAALMQQHIAGLIPPTNAPVIQPTAQRAFPKLFELNEIISTGGSWVAVRALDAPPFFDAHLFAAF